MTESTENVQQSAGGPPPLPASAGGQTVHSDLEGYDEPQGDAAVMPDRPLLTAIWGTLAAVLIVLLATFLGMQEYLGASSRAQQAERWGAPNPDLAAFRTADAQRVTEYGFDENTGLYNVPIAQAMAQMVTTQKVACAELWPNLKPADVPEPSAAK